MNTVKRLWASISEPRHLKVFYFSVYVTTTVVGVVTCFIPPATVEGELGTTVTLFWAILLTAGGVGGAVSVLPGWWWAERSANLLMALGTSGRGDARGVRSAG